MSLTDITQKYNSALSKTVSMLSCFVLVAFAWIFFRANSVDDAFIIIQKIFTQQGKLFVDAGMLGKPDDFDPETMYYSDKVRVAVGTGFLWQSPLGMINLDFAFPVVKDRYDDKRIIRLNFGKGF